MAGVTFVPADEHTSVEINVQALDETIVVTAGKPYSTDDPGEIAALDETPTLERKTAKTKSSARKAGVPEPATGDTPQEPPAGGDS
jgi:hypothetical protein